MCLSMIFLTEQLSIFVYAVMLPKLPTTRNGNTPVPLLKLVRSMPKLVEDVSKTEITESSAIIRWKKDNKQNPVDSISIMPMMNTTLPGVSRYLTIEEMMQGFAEVDGLTKNTLYAVNLYDTSKPRKYDKPYNQVTFRTAGPSAMSIPVGLDDDLSAMLLNNDVDPEVPEGTEYYLPAGSSYRVTPFSLMKASVWPAVVMELNLLLSSKVVGALQRVLTFPAWSLIILNFVMKQTITTL